MADEYRERGTVPPGHPAFAGHFPGRPLVPAVVILDWVQAAARAAWSLPPLAGLPAAKFVAPLAPGDAYEIVLARSDAGVAFRVVRGEVLVAQGTLRFRPAP